MLDIPGIERPCFPCFPGNRPATNTPSEHHPVYRAECVCVQGYKANAEISTHTLHNLIVFCLVLPPTALKDLYCDLKHANLTFSYASVVFTHNALFFMSLCSCRLEGSGRAFPPPAGSERGVRGAPGAN